VFSSWLACTGNSLVGACRRDNIALLSCSIQMTELMTSEHTIVEPGRIVAIEAGAAWVETQRNSTCSSCSAQKACGHGLINANSNRGSHRVLVTLDEGDNSRYVVDEVVELTIDEAQLVRAALLMYLLPLLGLLAGASLGAAVGPGDLSAVIGAMAGFVLALYVVSRLGVAGQARFGPRLRPVPSD